MRRVRIGSHWSFEFGLICALFLYFTYMANIFINTILWFLKLKLTILCRVGTFNKRERRTGEGVEKNQNLISREEGRLSGTGLSFLKFE